MNPDYQGTRELNKALRDRFRIVRYEYEKRIENKLIENKKLIYFAGKLREMYSKGEINFPCSTRMLIQYETDIKLFGEVASRSFFINKFPIEEQRVIQTAMEANLDNISSEEVDKLQEKEFGDDEDE